MNDASKPIPVGSPTPPQPIPVIDLTMPDIPEIEVVDLASSSQHQAIRDFNQANSLGAHADFQHPLRCCEE